MGSASTQVCVDFRSQSSEQFGSSGYSVAAVSAAADRRAIGLRRDDEMPHSGQVQTRPAAPARQRPDCLSVFQFGDPRTSADHHARTWPGTQYRRSGWALS
jgi:hypothetical protein